MISHFEFDNETLLTIKHSNPDMYRLLREFEVSEKPYHETLDREKFKREADMGLLNAEDFFGKKQIMDAVETFEGEKSIKTTFRKSASVGSSEMPREYFYISMYSDKMTIIDYKWYEKEMATRSSTQQIILNHRTFCYTEGFVTEEEANERIDMFLSFHGKPDDNLELAP